MLSDLLIASRPKVIDLTAASAGAGATPVACRPAAGKLWIITALYGYHTAGANRDCYWTYEDPSGTIQLYETSVLGSSVRWFANEDPLSVQNVIIGPLVCTNYRFPAFNWTALGAGENGYVAGIAQEIDLPFQS